MLCCAVLCCAVLCCAVLCCAVLCCAVLCCAVLCCAVLRVVCCAVLCCAVLCCGMVWCDASCAMPRAAVVIIDEASMLDLYMTRSLLRALPLPSRRRVHLLFVGDPDQLPSVGPGACHSHCWGAVTFVVGFVVVAVFVTSPQLRL